MSEPHVAIQVVMVARDANPQGTICGSVLLSPIDPAGAIGAARSRARVGGSCRHWSRVGRGYAGGAGLRRR